MRILHVDYQQLRRYGLNRVSWAQKLLYGLIKNDHYVQSFSDRDVAAFEAPLGIRDLGKTKANRKLLETFEATEPDLIILGHCDIITNETVAAMKALNPNVAVTYCNNDPLFMPDNVEKIRHRCEVADSVFISTGWKELGMFSSNSDRVFHMPNPVDPSIERFDSSKRDNLATDLIFCGNSNQNTARLDTVKFIKDNVDSDCVFSTYGCFGTDPVWGIHYDKALSQSKMGLNLSRQTGHHWYSSARMAQLGGNGILAFTHASHKFDQLFPEESIAYFETDEDLLSAIKRFHNDDAARKHFASRTREFFHGELNSTLYAQFIVETSLNLPLSHDYVWQAKYV